MYLNKKKADQIADFLLQNDEKYINQLEKRGFKREEGLSKFAKKRQTITVAEFLMRLGFDIKQDVEGDDVSTTFLEKFLHQLLVKIIKRHESIDILKKKFKKIDKKFTGLVNMKKFKEILTELDI